MVAVLKSLIWELFTQQFQYLWIPTMNEGQKTLKKGKNSAAMKIFDIWIGLDGVEKMGIGGWVAWWKHISHYFQHPSPVSHAPPFVTQCSTNPQIPSQTNPKNQQNTKFLNMNISGLAWYIIRIDCWSFVGLIVIHKNYTPVNQSKILNTFWYIYQRLWMEQWASFIKGTLRALFSIKRKLALSAFTAGSLGTSELRGL